MSFCLRLLAPLALAAACLSSSPALAWGNDGHRIIALIARHYIDKDPVLAGKIDALLAGPTDPALQIPGFAEYGTWADRYRASSEARGRKSEMWHYIDIDTVKGDPAAACFNNPALPPGVLASEGPREDCIVGKINQFMAELRDPSLPAEERKLALLFLLHFVGDIHQPLHAAERNGDAGGNAVTVVIGDNPNGTSLHSYWDTGVLARFGGPPEYLAKVLIDGISEAEIKSWTLGAPKDRALNWALESFATANQSTYGALPATTRKCLVTQRDAPPAERDCYPLGPDYENQAGGKAAQRLQMAGVRLAALLADALR